LRGTVLIYGATGYTGKLIAKEAAGLGARPILAGRDLDKVQAIAKRSSLPFAPSILAIQSELMRGSRTLRLPRRESPPRLIRVDRPIGLDPVGELGRGSPDRRCISCANLITALSAPSATERNTQKRKKRRDANRSGRLRRDQVRQINPFCRLRAMTDDKGKLAVPPLSPRAP
jgi:hypothetical protein